MTIDELAARVDARFAALDQGIDARFTTLESKMDEGFKDAKIRDEELRDLAKLGIEVTEILRDEMNRRFDATDQKNDEQITLLKAAIRQNVTNR